MKVKINQLQCKRCGHQWTPRKSDVRMCPSCKSTLWDKPRKGIKANQREILKYFAADLLESVEYPKEAGGIMSDFFGDRVNTLKDNFESPKQFVQLLGQYITEAYKELA